MLTLLCGTRYEGLWQGSYSGDSKQNYLRRSAEMEGVETYLGLFIWSDFFIEEADKWREEAWEVMRKGPQHIYMLLTKRAELIWKGLPDDWEPAAYPNVWLGVSVEDQYRFNRIERVRRVPARVHFASCEPLLGPLPGMPLEHMEWVIVGGESGPHHRPMDPEWVRQIRNQCILSHVPFFFKQWGGLRPGGNRLLDGKIWDQYPNLVRTLEIAP